MLTYILIRAVAPDKDTKYYVVSVFSHKDKDCAVKISCAESLITLAGLCDRCRIIAVDSGLTEEERKKLNAAFRRDANVLICDIDEISDVLTE